MAKPLVQVSVEADPAWLSPYGAVQDTLGRALYSAVVTLTLGVLGSTILPVPYAFSKMGILVGVITIVVVASVNAVTCCMLVRAADFTGCYTYEELAEWAGGRTCKVTTQTTLILLLYGTLCGGMAFLSDVARIMVLKGLPGAAPQLLQDDGRPVMLLVVVLVLLPLCLQRHVRQFEKAATVGVVVVVALSTIIISKAVALGFPAVRDGQLSLFSLKIDSHLPEAFSVLGFAFYMQPMLMPVIKEMPRGPGGVVIAERAVHLVLYGVASLAYGTVGVFGASIYGEATESNIMVNDVLDSPRDTLILYAALMLYLCCGMVTTHYALRASLDVLLVGADAPYNVYRSALQTACILAAAALVAITFPTEAEKIFALTGCTAVCVCCYCIPVYIHLQVEARRRAKAQAAYAAENYANGDCDGDGDGVPEYPTFRIERSQQGLGGSRDTSDSCRHPEEEAGTGAGTGTQAGASSSLRAPLLEASTSSSRPAAVAAATTAAMAAQASVLQAALGWVQPCFVLIVGVGCSVAGLYVAAVDFYKTYIEGG